MELKIWVEGIQRIVCGVTETTTCHDVVFALAHATGKAGRFTLIERWRNNERQLAPNENPLKILTKWGEYSNDVQFILQFNTDTKNTTTKIKTTPEKNTPSPDLGLKMGQNAKKLEVRENFGSAQNSPKKGSCSGSEKSESPIHRIAPPYKDPPAPPPYRDPPPPSNYQIKDLRLQKEENKTSLHESVLYNAQYRELVALINYQRDKLVNQQTDLTKFDAEIIFWEGKDREKQMQLEYIAQELVTVANTGRLNQNQVQALGYIEEENELVKQQEKTLKSEITLLRSKLANCETELLQCKNKIRLVMDEIQIEQRANQKRNDSKRQLEKGILCDVEKIQKDIESAKQSSDLHHVTAETLKIEVAALELAIHKKKQEVEHLISEMKEANLESLTVAPPEDIRFILEGPCKTGSARKMIGSPRQLENAVPTNKNPHGVWV